MEWCVGVDRTMASKGVHILIPGPCEHVTSQGERDFGRVGRGGTDGSTAWAGPGDLSGLEKGVAGSKNPESVKGKALGRWGSNPSSRAYKVQCKLGT